MVRKPFFRNYIKSWDFLLGIIWFVYMVAGLLAYTVWAFTESGEPNSFDQVLQAARYAVYLLCIILTILFSKFKTRSFLLCFLILALSTVIMLTSGNRMVFFLALLMMTFYGRSEEWLLKTSFVATALVLFVVVLLSQIGIIEDYIRIDAAASGERIRHFLGFSWATYAAIFFFFLVLEYIALKKGKLRFWEYVLFVLLDFWLFMQTNTRLAFLITLVMLTFFLIFGKRLHKVRYVHLYDIFLIVPWIVAGGSIALHAMYNPASALWIRLNDLLSGRLSLGQQALADYPITLFGQHIEWVGWDMGKTMNGAYNYVDCSYLQILLQEGVIYLVVILLLLTLIIKYAINRKKYYLVWIITFMMLLSITEPWMIASIAVNPFLLCLCNRDAKTADLPVVTSQISFNGSVLRS